MLNPSELKDGTKLGFCGFQHESCGKDDSGLNKRD